VSIFDRTAVRDLALLREELLAINKTTQTKLDRIMKTQAEVQAALETATNTLVKVRKEQKDRFDAQTVLIDELKKLIADGVATPGVEAAVLAFEAKLAEFDADVADAPAAPAAAV